MIPLRYSEADSAQASKSWRATCGPHSIAAACGLTLDQVRPALSDYRGWMNPTQMGNALRALGFRYRLISHLRTSIVCHGISRVQFEGPWLNPGVPPTVAYRYTHWVAHYDGWVLCTACEPARWIRIDDWRSFHLTVEPVSPFHITHHYILA